MELALGAMASLAPKLGDLLMAEYIAQKGLEPDIKSLSRELVVMKASLEDSSRIPSEQLSNLDKLWARQVRELSYDMEDAIDDFVLRVAGGECAADATDANVFKKILGKATAAVKKVKHRHKISDKIKDIKKLSNELAELRAKYTVRGVGADLAASTGTDPHVLNLYKKESDLVGIEESRDKLCHNIEQLGRVLDLKDQPAAFFIKHLRSYRHLDKAVITLDCAGASMCEVEKLEAAFRHAAEVHCNHPSIQLIRTNTDEMVSSSDHPDAKLMCLIAEGFRRFPTDKMGNLISLKELRLKSVVGRTATEDLVVELGKQTRLRAVTITFSEELERSLQKALVQSLCNLQELQELELFFTGLSQQGATVWEEDWEAPRQLQRLLIDGITFWRLPGWINRSRLPLLCFLSLSVYVVEVLDLYNLGRLPELGYLELVGHSWPPGYIVGTDGFRNLRFCYVGTALKFHRGAMPRLEELVFAVYAGYWSWEVNGVPLEQFPTKDVIEDLDLGLDNLLSLEKVMVIVYCLGATAVEVKEVEALVTRAVENHPNRPTIKTDRLCEENILSDERRVALLQQHIERHLRVLDCKDQPDASFISCLRRYRHLQKAVNFIDCAGASTCEVEKVEAAFRHAAEVHPNHPSIQLIRTNTDKMVSSSDHSDTELGDDHDDSPDNLLRKLQLRN